MNPKFIQKFEDAGMKFVGRSTDGERMEIMELEGNICLLQTLILQISNTWYAHTKYQVFQDN